MTSLDHFHGNTDIPAPTLRHLSAAKEAALKAIKDVAGRFEETSSPHSAFVMSDDAMKVAFAAHRRADEQEHHGDKDHFGLLSATCIAAAVLFCTGAAIMTYADNFIQLATALSSQMKIGLNIAISLSFVTFIVTLVMLPISRKKHHWNLELEERLQNVGFRNKWNLDNLTAVTSKAVAFGEKIMIIGSMASDDAHAKAVYYEEVGEIISTFDKSTGPKVKIMNKLGGSIATIYAPSRQGNAAATEEFVRILSDKCGLLSVH